MRFIRIATQMFPAERIEFINREANINGQLGIEVKLWGVNETFQYTGEYASMAFDALQGIEPAPAPPVFLVALPDGDVPVVEVEWVDFAANVNGNTGVEVRIATDPVGMTRQYTGQTASQVYDILASYAEIAVGA